MPYYAAALICRVGKRYACLPFISFRYAAIMLPTIIFAAMIRFDDAATRWRCCYTQEQYMYTHCLFI